MKCVKPLKINYKKNKAEYSTLVPCGHCINCRITRVSQWIIRIQSESSGKDIPTTFLTLTYSDDYNKSNQIIKKDIQLFNKRLRKAGYKFKYVIVGEYGDITKRPHYHGIYIGLGINSKELEKIWGLGHTHQGTVTEASIRYTLSYIFKNLEEETPEGKEKPFMLSSKNWGKEWIHENIWKMHHNGYICKNGKKIPIPKYLKDKYPGMLKKSALSAQMDWVRKYKTWIKSGNTLEALKKDIIDREQLGLRIEKQEQMKQRKIKI